MHLDMSSVINIIHPRMGDLADQAPACDLLNGSLFQSTGGRLVIPPSLSGTGWMGSVAHHRQSG